MKDGFTSTQKGWLRTRPQTARWYVAVHRPRKIDSYAITGTPNNHPVSAITLTAAGGGGNFSGIEEGTTVWVGTGAGLSDLGKIRARGPVAASILPIMESGSGLVNWTQATHLTAYEEYKPWSKHKRYVIADECWYMDYNLSYTDQLDTFKPYVNMGPPVVGVLDPTTGKFSASFYGNRSLFWDSAVASQRWAFPDGQVVTSLLGTCDNPVVMTFTNASNSGSYFSLSVTDAAGNSAIGRRLIFLMASMADFDRVTFGQIQGGIENGGYNAFINAYNAANSDKYPEGAEIVIFEKASYGAQGSSLGGNFPHRESTLFRGWLVSENTRITPTVKDVMFEAKTVDGIMQQAHSYDVLLHLRFQGLSSWQETASLCLDRTAHYMLTFHSTLGQIVDFWPASGLAIGTSLPGQSIGKAPFWEQLKLNYGGKGMLGHVAADMQSNIYAFEDVNITGNSTNLPIAMEVIKSDRRDAVVIPSMHIDENAQTMVAGVARTETTTSYTGTAYGGQSPGPLYGYWGGYTEHTRGTIVESQDHMITWAGNMRAKMNNRYKSVRVPLAGNYRVDAVPAHRVTMTLSPNENPREIDWNNAGFIQKQLMLDYNAKAGFVRAEIELEKIVNGIGGSAYTFPALPDIYPLPPITPPTVVTPPGTAGGPGTGTVFAIGDGQSGGIEIFRTLNLSADSPTWTDINAGADVTGQALDFILDPWDPDGTAYAYTNYGLWKITNIKSASPTFTQIITVAQAHSESGVPSGGFNTWGGGGRMYRSINNQNWMGLVSKFGIAGGTTNWLFFTYTNDNWATRSWVQIHQQRDITLYGTDYVPHLIGGNIMVYVSYSVYGTGTRISKTTNGGASWSTVKTGTYGEETWESLHCPFSNNSSGNRLLAYNVTTGANRFGWSNDGGVTWTAVGAHADGLVSGMGGPSRNAIEQHPADENQVYAIADVSQEFYKWTNGLDDTSGFTSYDMSSIFNQYQAYGCGGFPYNNAQFYLVGLLDEPPPGFNGTDKVWLTQDNGLSWTDKTGNLNMTGGKPKFVVPVWTE